MWESNSVTCCQLQVSIPQLSVYNALFLFFFLFQFVESMLFGEKLFEISGEFRSVAALGRIRLQDSGA